ncbi:Barrel-sandwich domain of CusB or HlyD membrane-fusion [Pseudoduganella namucuonensis]|uniref:Barrel-sandwich domain of CusB or HlyD membrane-fusion n=2 Tax=Pseudoduganella namucuonensis TaxID=1035707 RepID=A0A1I7KHC2_9BURK|nr:Barrel-sandwich domain of CusB or HlyD membrane-fusion [Pseudoduganella namucuonensis]
MTLPPPCATAAAPVAAAARTGPQESIDHRGAQGYTESARLCTLRADSAGDVTALLVKAGDRVKAGQVLARIGQSDVTAHYDGVVSATFARVGEAVAPGRHLVTMYDPTRMRVVASVPRSQLRDINLDEPVEIDVAATSQRLTVQKVIVISQAEKPMPMAKVYLELGEVDGLRPGQLARASFGANGGARH